MPAHPHFWTTQELPDCFEPEQVSSTIPGDDDAVGEAEAAVA